MWRKAWIGRGMLALIHPSWDYAAASELSHLTRSLAPSHFSSALNSPLGLGSRCKFPFCLEENKI